MPSAATTNDPPSNTRSSCAAHHVHVRDGRLDLGARRAASSTRRCPLPSSNGEPLSTTSSDDLVLVHLRDRAAVLPDVLADHDADAPPATSTTQRRRRARRSGTRRTRRSWAGGACRSAPAPGRAGAGPPGWSGAAGPRARRARAPASPTSPRPCRRARPGRRAPSASAAAVALQRGLGARGGTTPAARGPRSGSRSASSRGTRRGRRPPRRPSRAQSRTARALRVDVAHARVDLREGDAEVRHGPSLTIVVRPARATTCAVVRRTVHQAGCTAWTGSRSSCSARSRSGTSASSVSGSPTCSGSSSRWRSRPPSSRPRSPRASASTAAPSRA